MTPRSHRLAFAFLIATALVASVSASAHARQTRTERAGPGEAFHLAAVTGDDVYVRSGAADSYYPFGRVQRGNIVKVTREKFNWHRVLTTGPAFDAFFGYIRCPKDETGRFRLENDGTSGRTLGRVDILAPNLNTGFEPRDSWKIILTVEADTVLGVLENIQQEHEIVYKVALLDNAAGWINGAFLRPATEEEIAAWTAAMNPPEARVEAEPAAAATEEPTETGEERASVLAREEPTVPPVVEASPAVGNEGSGEKPGSEEAATGAPEEEHPTLRPEDAEEAQPSHAPSEAESAPPAPPVSGHKAALDDLEAKYARLQGEPIESAEVAPLRQLYLDLAQDAAKSPTIARYATARAEQLAIWAELQQQRNEITRLRQRIRMRAEETQAVRLALDTTVDYAAVGRLAVSTIYDGQRLPKLYRVQDPATGRTIAYLRPDEGFDLPGMLDQIVGIVGVKSFDDGLRLNLVQPRRIDLLTPGS